MVKSIAGGLHLGVSMSLSLICKMGQWWILVLRLVREISELFWAVVSPQGTLAVLVATWYYHSPYEQGGMSQQEAQVPPLGQQRAAEPRTPCLWEKAPPSSSPAGFAGDQGQDTAVPASAVYQPHRILPPKPSRNKDGHQLANEEGKRALFR